MTRKRRLRRWLFLGCGLALLYALSYVGLSALGEYRPDVSGRTRWASGVGFTDCELWQPLGIYHKRYLTVGGTRTTSANPLGWFYAPLVAADRAWVHESRYLFE
jgi:hypothetical protein